MKPFSLYKTACALNTFSCLKTAGKLLGITTFISISLGLSACALNPTSPNYACGLPHGVSCKPVDQVYNASVAGTLPSSALTQSDKTLVAPLLTHDSATTATPIASVRAGDALLTRPRVLRIWIRDWQDIDGDLHSESYVYLRLDNGAWVMNPPIAKE